MDLTAITVCYGLLDETYGPGTSEDFHAHGGPYEIRRGFLWGDHTIGDDFDPWYTYRVKPTPPKPREWWAVGLHLHKTRDDAERFLRELSEEYPNMNFGHVIHVREVLE